MDKKIVLALCAFIISGLGLMTAIEINRTSETVSHEVVDEEEDKLGKLYPYEDYFVERNFPYTDFDVDGYYHQLRSLYDFDKVAARNLGTWELEGPSNIGGRINAIAVHPTDPKIIFLGFSAGGLFRTKDGGATWKAVFDNQMLLAIGEVTFDPSNPSTVYVGTGDVNISGFTHLGDGVYRSLDGGDTWTNIGLGSDRIVSQIRIPKSATNIIYASTMGNPFARDDKRGLYKSVNKGVTWSKILYINDSTGIIDLALHPTDPNILYASAWNRIRTNKQSLVSGPDAKIYKTTDGGQSWKVLDGGLPMDVSGRIGIDICTSNPNVLYAAYTHPTTHNLKGVYTTKDGGTTWQDKDIVNLQPNRVNMYGGFGWYFGKIKVNPSNPDDVYILGVDLYRSKEGGDNFELAAPPWFTYDVHADKHDLVFSGNNLYLATDGGAYSAKNQNELDWSDIENIPSTQFYRVAFHDFDGKYYGGAQDNGTSSGTKDDMNAWERVFGGDGFQTVFHPTEDSTFIAETQNGGLVITYDYGDIWSGATAGISAGDVRNWDMPIIKSYTQKEILYTGTDKVYRSSSWDSIAWEVISPYLPNPDVSSLRKSISTIDESPVNPSHLAVGTTDGRLWVSEDQGATWQLRSSGLPSRYIASVVYSPNTERTLYSGLSGYRDNDNTPHLYRSIDGGGNWTSIQGDLPSAAINKLLVLPDRNGKIDRFLLVATNGGIYYTINAGQNWQRMGNNIPFVPVYDIVYNPLKNEIIAGTFARSIYTFDLRQINYPDIINSVKDITSLTENIQIRDCIGCENVFVSTRNTQPIMVEYHIVDAGGKICKSGSLQLSEEAIVSKQGLYSGLYYIRLSTSYGIFSKAIIVL